MVINNWFFIGSIVCIAYAFCYLLGEAVLFGRLKKFQYFFAPIAGYALYAYLFFFLFHLTTNRPFTIAVTTLLAATSSYLFLKRKKFPSATFFWSLMGATFFAAYAAYVLSPKISTNHFLFAPPVFDHMKTAITASIVNQGLPVINPFAAFPFKLHYYFLFFVPCAAIKIMFGITAFQAEIIGTMLAAFMGVGALTGTVTILKGHDISRKELLICCLLALTAASKLAVPFLTGGHGFDSLVETLLWTPSTLIATSCLVLVLVLVYKTSAQHRWLLAILLAVILGISSYIAIVTALSLSLLILLDIYKNPEKKKIIQQWINVILLSALLAAPFLFNQAGAAKQGFPIEIALYPWTTLKNPIIQVAGFWTIFCFLQMPALFIINTFYFRIKYFKKYIVFYIPILMGTAVTCFLKTNIANNDLGWRASFVAVFLLTILASYWLCISKNRLLKGIFLLFILACIRFPFSPLDWKHRNWNEPKQLSSESIKAIQTHISTRDYFLNNTFDYTWLVPQDGNLEFMIESERKSCYASGDAILAYADHNLYPFLALSHIIFQEKVTAQDILKAKRISCSKFIFHYTDPNFEKEEMLQNAGLEKIYQNEQIKIYRLNPSLL